MDFSLFRNKNFSILIIGQMVSILGNNIQNLALSLYILSITQSTAQFASVLVVTMIPKIFLGPVAGVFVDRWDRKKLVVCLDLLCGLVTFLAAFQFYRNGCLGLIEIYTLAGVFSLIGIFLEPALGTIIPSIIEKDKLMQANSLTSFIFSSINLLGPLVSGMLYGFFGLFIILVINAVTFLFSGLCEMMLSLPKIEKCNDEKKKTIRMDLMEGVCFLKGHKILLNMVFMSLAINFVYTPIMSIGVIHISKNFFKVSDPSLGLLQSGLVLAGLVSPLVISIISNKLSVVRIYLFTIVVIAFDLGMISLATSDLFVKFGIVGYKGFVIMGLFVFINVVMIGVLNMASSTFHQKETPNEMLGRVTTLRSTLTVSIIPLGQILYGFLFEFFAVWQCVLLSSAIMFIVIVTLGRKLFEMDKTITLKVAEGV